jgi:hypothetical protein
VASSDQGGTGADRLMEVLIAQLHRNGTLSGPDISNMKRRLTEAGHEHLADTLGMIVLSDMIDDPGERRASLHAIDGGNPPD